MRPCDNYECENWDSDKNGGHCMLLSPGYHFNQYTCQYYCDSFKKPESERQIIVKKTKKPRG